MTRHEREFEDRNMKQNWKEIYLKFILEKKTREIQNRMREKKAQKRKPWNEKRDGKPEVSAWRKRNWQLNIFIEKL